jgi:hypothetical protein
VTVFVDVENELRLFLLPRVSPLLVSNRVPNPRPASFVHVWRSGGSAANRALDRPLITLTAWAGTDTAAFDAVSACRQVLHDSASELPLLRGLEELSGPYRDPDPDSGSPRYSMTVRLFVRAARAVL